MLDASILSSAELNFFSGILSQTIYCLMQMVISNCPILAYARDFKNHIARIFIDICHIHISNRPTFLLHQVKTILQYN